MYLLYLKSSLPSGFAPFPQNQACLSSFSLMRIFIKDSSVHQITPSSPGVFIHSFIRMLDIVEETTVWVLSAGSLIETFRMRMLWACKQRAHPPYICVVKVRLAKKKMAPKLTLKEKLAAQQTRQSKSQGSETEGWRLQEEGATPDIRDIMYQPQRSGRAYQIPKIIPEIHFHQKL